MPTNITSLTSAPVADKFNIVNSDAVRVNDNNMYAAAPVRILPTEDPSGMVPTFAPDENYAWLRALLNGKASRDFSRSGMEVVNLQLDDGTCEKAFIVGKQGNLIPFTMEGTPCCTRLPKSEGRAFHAKPGFLCVEDCLTDTDIYWMLHDGSADDNRMSTLLGLKGSDAYQRRLDLLRRAFIYQVARQFLLGEEGVFGANLLPFPGLADVIAKASTINLDGSFLVPTITNLECFFELRSGDWIALGNPVAIKSLNMALDSIASSTNTPRMFSNVRTFEVTDFGFNEGFSSDIWMFDLNYVGAFIDRATSSPTLSDIETDQTVQDDQSAGACKVICNRLRGTGGVFSYDFNAAIRISDVAAPNACLPFIGRTAARGFGSGNMIPR